MANKLRPINSSSRILDNGAGSGAVCGQIARRCPEARILATDINRQMLDTITSESPLLEKRVIDTLELSSHLPPNSFSHVFCSFVLHTIKGPTRCLQQMRTVLQNEAESGVIGLSVWGWKLDHFDIWIAACRTVDPQYELPRLADDENCWRTEVELREKLVEAGFRDIHTASVMMPWPFESAEQYSSFWFGPNPIGKSDQLDCLVVRWMNSLFKLPADIGLLSNFVAELCRKSVAASMLPSIKTALENTVKQKYNNGKLISAEAACAVARR